MGACRDGDVPKMLGQGAANVRDVMSYIGTCSNGAAGGGPAREGGFNSNAVHMIAGVIGALGYVHIARRSHSKVR